MLGINHVLNALTTKTPGTSCIISSYSNYLKTRHKEVSKIYLRLLRTADSQRLSIFSLLVMHQVSLHARSQASTSQWIVGKQVWQSPRVSSANPLCSIYLS